MFHEIDSAGEESEGDNGFIDPVSGPGNDYNEWGR